MNIFGNVSKIKIMPEISNMKNESFHSNFDLNIIDFLNNVYKKEFCLMVLYIWNTKNFNNNFEKNNTRGKKIKYNIGRLVGIIYQKNVIFCQTVSFSIFEKLPLKIMPKQFRFCWIWNFSVRNSNINLSVGNFENYLAANFMKSIFSVRIIQVLLWNFGF